MPDRVGLAEIAELLGVHKQTVLRYTQRTGFPQPAEQLASGRVWKRVDIERWAKANLPLQTGRPRRTIDRRQSSG